jgi:hypothetical protein
MRLEDLPAQSWLSPTLTSEVAARVQAGEQALLFLNRRGYAPVTLCRACGAQVGCDHCDARMVEHRFLKRLVCHQCGETKPLPEACPVCGVEGKMAAVGPGVERVAEEAVAAFPGREDRGPVLGPLRVGPRAQGPDRGDRGGRHRHHHRHAAGGEGAQFPAPDAGGAWSMPTSGFRAATCARRSGRSS